MKSNVRVSKREKMLILLVFATLQFSVVKFFLLKFWHASHQVENEMILLRSEIEKDSLSLAKVLSERAPASLDSKVGEISIGQIVEENSQFTKFVRSLAVDEQLRYLEILRVTNEKSESFNGSTKIVYTVEVQGPFLQIQKFIEFLESSPLMVELNSFDLSKIDGDVYAITGKLTFTNIVMREML